MSALLADGVGTNEQGGCAFVCGIVDIGPAVQEHRQRVDVVLFSGFFGGCGVWRMGV